MASDAISIEVYILLETYPTRWKNHYDVCCVL